MTLTLHPRNRNVLFLSFALLALSFGSSGLATAQEKDWVRVTEDDRAIKIETDKLEAVIPKKNPKQWMTGIEKGSFLDKTTGFREIGDGLMVVDWLMEAGQRRGVGRQGVRQGRPRRRPLLAGTRTRPTRRPQITPSWPTAAATASAWSRGRSSATG